MSWKPRRGTQPERPDLHLLFAPLKQARLEYMVQKAVEMGVGRITSGVDPLHAGQTAQARQDGSLCHRSGRAMRYSRHSGNRRDAAPARCRAGRPATSSFATKGMARRTRYRSCKRCRAVRSPCSSARKAGSTRTERTWLNGKDNVTAIPLGPRVLRADTAAVAALAVVQAVLGGLALVAPPSQCRIGPCPTRSARRYRFREPHDPTG